MNRTMSDKQEHWKQLAESLGADDAADAQQSGPRDEESVTELPPVQVPPPPKRESKPPESAGERHWDSLASELGLAAPPAPAPSEPPPSAPVDEPTAAGVDEPASSAMDTETDTAREAEPEQLVTAPEPSRPVEDAIDLDRDESEDPLALDARPFVEELEEEEDYETVEPEEPSSEADDEQRLRKRRRRRGRRRRREDAEAPAEGSSEVGEAKVGDEPEYEDEETAALTESAEGEESRAPRRRRRRGPRGERAPSAKGKADRDEFSDEDADEELSDEPAEVEAEEGSDGARADRPRPKHRKIPSWSEAMDHIISGNMASRSRGSGRNPPRGRR
jgi:hypothetical protein